MARLNKPLRIQVANFFSFKKKTTFDAPLNDTDIYSFGLASPIKGFPYMINRMSYDQTLMK
jgi:hypothetical protein